MGWDQQLGFFLIKDDLVTTTIEYVICHKQRPMIWYYPFIEIN